MQKNLSDSRLRNLLDSFANAYLAKQYQPKQSLEMPCTSLERRWLEQSTSATPYVSPVRRHYANGQLYTLVSLLLPTNLHSLDIDMLDTLFYMGDNSIVYIFRDAKKGLLKISRNINFCQLFLKRRQSKDGQTALYHKLSSSNISSKLSPRTSSPNIFSTTFTSCESLGSPKMQYVALLRYKDNSFTRLRTTDLKIIFTNPLSANEIFKNTNNTQYIQGMPNDSLHRHTVAFDYDTFHLEPLFKLACELLSKENAFNQQTQHDRQRVKVFLMSNSIEAYLHYVVFEIYCYVSMHHNRKITSGVFQFYAHSTAYLASVDSLVLEERKKKQFEVKALFEEELRLSSAEEKENQHSTVLKKEMNNYFTECNRRLQENIDKFLDQKMTKLLNVKDRQASDVIFKVLNPCETEGFHTILSSYQKMSRVVEAKRSIDQQALLRHKKVKIIGITSQEPEKENNKNRENIIVKVCPKKFKFMGKVRRNKKYMGIGGKSDCS